VSERLVQIVAHNGDADAVCACLDGHDTENWIRLSAADNRTANVALRAAGLAVAVGAVGHGWLEFMW